jgi:hypothetical protein
LSIQLILGDVLPIGFLVKGCRPNWFVLLLLVVRAMGFSVVRFD